jgi:N utilization substance protein B
MATRREARERALGLCYEIEARGLSADEVLGGLVATPDPYAATLVRGVDEHRDEIDAHLRKLSEHWALERMPAIDRALLRIGGYELGWQPEIPIAVVIDEAVDLARQYSTKDSGRFVNALLSRLSAELRP